MKISQEEYDQIESLSALNYSPEKIAIYLSFDKKEFMKEWKDATSLVRYHYDKGQLEVDVVINTKLLENAKSGNITAAQMIEKKQWENKIENWKKQILYD